MLGEFYISSSCFDAARLIILTPMRLPSCSSHSHSPGTSLPTGQHGWNGHRREEAPKLVNECGPTLWRRRSRSSERIGQDPKSEECYELKQLDDWSGIEGDEVRFRRGMRIGQVSCTPCLARHGDLPTVLQDHGQCCLLPAGSLDPHSVIKMA